MCTRCLFWLYGVLGSGHRRTTLYFSALCQQRIFFLQNFKIWQQSCDLFDLCTLQLILKLRKVRVFFGGDKFSRLRGPGPEPRGRTTLGHSRVPSLILDLVILPKQYLVLQISYCLSDLGVGETRYFCYQASAET